MSRLGRGLLVLLGIGVVAGGGYGVMQLRREQAASQERLARLRLLRGYTETARQLIGRGDLGPALLALDEAYAEGPKGPDGPDDSAVRTLLPLLSARASLHLHTLQHDGEVTAVRFSPDGQLALTASADRTARLWSTTTGAEQVRLVGHTAALAGAWFSGDSQRVLTLTKDGQARLFRIPAKPGQPPGQLIALLAEPGEAPPPLWSATFTPDGTRIVTLAQGATAATLWDGLTGQRLATLGGHEAPILTAAVTPTGSVLQPPGPPPAAVGPDSGPRVVTVSPQRVMLWDAGRGTLVAALRGHTDHIKDAILSPDGQRVVTTSADTTARLWDARTGQLVATLEGHTGTVYSAGYTLAGGKAIMTISADGSARLWDARTGQPMFLPVGHPRYSQILGVTPDGARMVVSSESEAMELWDRILGHMRAQLLPSTRDVLATAFSPNGRRLATGLTDGTTRIWDGRSGQPLLVLRGHRDRVLAVALSRDGSLVLTGSADGSARIFRSRINGYPQPLDGHPSEISSVGFSADGRRLVSTSRNGSVRVWQVQGSDLLQSLSGHRRAVESARFLAPAAAGGPERVLSMDPGGSDGNGRFPADVRIWDAATGAQLGALNDSLDYGRVLALGPDGERIATALPDGRVHLYRPSGAGSPGPQRIAELVGHAVEPKLGAFSPDGALLATASADGDIVVWDGRAGGRLAALKGHSGALRALTFDARGRVLTGSVDGSVRIFAPRTGALLASLPGHYGEVRALHPSPSGDRLLSVDSGERAWLWELPEADEHRLIGALAKHGAKDYLAVAWTPDGRRLVTAGDEIRLWDGKTAAQIATLDDSGKLETFTALAISPDGNLLCTGTLTGQLKLWDVHPETRDPRTVHADLLTIPLVARSVKQTPPAPKAPPSVPTPP